MKHFTWLFYLGVIMLWSCAQVSSPTGGEADKTSPKILSSEPIIGATNYAKPQIKLTFDEFVQVRALAQNLVTSPPLSTVPKFLYKGKSLIFKFEEDSLIDNTTYYFYFGEAIADLNEGNVLDSNIFVFSTGNFIDSFQLKGIVKDAYTLEPVPDMFVLMYPQLEDSVPCNKRPTYFSKTNERGEFHVKYIKDGTYQIFALVDNNANYKFDLPNEKIGFLNEFIHTSSADSTGMISDSVLIYAFEESNEKQFLKSGKEQEYGKILLVFNRPVTDSISVKSLAAPLPPDWAEKQWLGNRDSLALWMANPEQFDSLKLEISIASDPLDTVLIKVFKLPENEEDKKGRKKKTPIVITSKNNVINQKLGTHDSLRITFSRPIELVDTTAIFFGQGTETLQYGMLQKDRQNLVFYSDWDEKINYNLILNKNAVQDKYGFGNDSTQIKFGLAGEDKYGYFYLSVLGKENAQYILQLLNDKGEIVEENIFTQSDSLSYEYLQPKNYKLKIIEDTNKDGKWSPGKYGSKTQAEKVLFYPYPIEIKANWEVEIVWEL